MRERALDALTRQARLLAHNLLLPKKKPFPDKGNGPT